VEDSRRLDVSKHTAHIGKRKMDLWFCSESLKVKDYLEDLNVDGMKIRNCCSKQYDGRLWTDLPGLKTDQCQVVVNTVMKLRAP
jgi:hypothetical protein